MKNLVLIRHAKAISENYDSDDFNRDLVERGVKDSKIMGGRLKKNMPQPDLFISSSSVRTTETTNLIVKKIETNCKVEFTEKLYLADVDVFESVISQVDNSAETIYICAHNPGITNFAKNIVGDVIYHITTAGVVFIKMEIDSWSEINTAKGELVEYDFPDNDKK